jgi:ABC-2 type transport system permease protein
MKTRTSETLFSISFVLSFPLLFLSDALFSINFLPSWVGDVAMFNPVNYAVNAIRALMINGYIWQSILPPWGVIALVAVVTLGVTIYQLRKVVS